MYVIALLSQKGGGGRTTLSVSLATAAEEEGKQTLIVDLDPQATACKWGTGDGRTRPSFSTAQAARLANALAKAREGGIELTIRISPAPPRPPFAAAKLAESDRHADPTPNV